MKKTLSLLLSAVIVLSALFCISGCKKEKSDIEKFFDQMTVENPSYEMEMEMNISMGVLGEMKADTNYKVEGDLMHMVMSFPDMGEVPDVETYMETKGDTVYTYAKNEEGKWQKDEGTKVDESEQEELITDMEFFKLENFEYSDEKGGYVLKKDIDIKEYKVSDLIFKFVDGNVEMSFNMDVEGVSTAVKSLIKNIGNTKVTLPTVE